jgi:hypothetical protein
MSKRKTKEHGFPNAKAYLRYIKSLREVTLDGRCHNCWQNFPNEELTLGHIIPACKGGKYEPKNIRPLCEKCNLEEGPHINEKFLTSIYYLCSIFNNRKIRRCSGHKFKSGYNTAVINGVFKSELTNEWCFSTICGSTIPVEKTFFL